MAAGASSEIEAERADTMLSGDALSDGANTGTAVIPDSLASSMALASNSRLTCFG